MTSAFIAALPMYDWPERRAEVDAEWAVFRDRMRADGLDVPQTLTRRNGDMPAVPGGIRDADGAIIAPDPATLPPHEFDLATLWRHPALIFGQTCWGPMQFGLARHVAVAAQPDYSGIPGGAGPLYSSAIVMRRADLSEPADCPAPVDGAALLPLDLLRGGILAFNSTDSMSGYLRLLHDLGAAGETLSLFSTLVQTGAHRASIQAVAQGTADAAPIDARSWQLAQLYEPAAKALAVVGWTSRSKGLPYIRARGLAEAPSLRLD